MIPNIEEGSPRSLDCETHDVSCILGTRGSVSPRVKRLGPENGHSLPCLRKFAAYRTIQVFYASLLRLEARIGHKLFAITCCRDFEVAGVAAIC
jgi:hypothetical protein